MWKTVFTYLKENDIEVYSQGQQRGLCDSSYVVLRTGKTGTFAGNSNVNGYSILQVQIYHPLARFSTLDDYVKEVKSYLRELRFLRYTGNETEAFIDDEKQAHLVIIDYQILKRFD